ADNDAPGVVVTAIDGSTNLPDGFSQVVEGDGVSFSYGNQTEDANSVVLTRPPEAGVTVSVHVTPAQGLVRLIGNVPQHTITSETQIVSLIDIASGHFTLTLDGNTTAPIFWDAPATGANSVQSALEAPAMGIGVGNVEVEQEGTTYTITFK